MFKQDIVCLVWLFISVSESTISNTVSNDVAILHPTVPPLGLFMENISIKKVGHSSVAGSIPGYE